MSDANDGRDRFPGGGDNQKRRDFSPDEANGMTTEELNGGPSTKRSSTTEDAVMVEVQGVLDKELFDLLAENRLELKYMKILADKGLNTVKLFGFTGGGDKATALRLLQRALELKEEDLAQVAALTGAWIDANRQARICKSVLQSLFHE